MSQPKSEGFRARQKQKVVERMMPVVDRTLEEGEKLEIVAYGLSTPRHWWAFLLGPALWTIAAKPYIVTLTDRRAIFFRMPKGGVKQSFERAQLEMMEPRSSLTVVKFSRGMGWTNLRLARSDGHELFLRFDLNFRPEAVEMNRVLGGPD